MAYSRRSGNVVVILFVTGGCLLLFFWRGNHGGSGSELQPIAPDHHSTSAKKLESDVIESIVSNTLPDLPDDDGIDFEEIALESVFDDVRSHLTLGDQFQFEPPPDDPERFPDLEIDQSAGSDWTGFPPRLSPGSKAPGLGGREAIAAKSLDSSPLREEARKIPKKRSGFSLKAEK